MPSSPRFMRPWEMPGPPTTGPAGVFPGGLRQPSPSWPPAGMIPELNALWMLPGMLLEPGTGFGGRSPAARVSVMDQAVSDAEQFLIAQTGKGGGGFAPTSVPRPQFTPGAPPAPPVSSTGEGGGVADLVSSVGDLARRFGEGVPSETQMALGGQAARPGVLTSFGIDPSAVTPERQLTEFATSGGMGDVGLTDIKNLVAPQAPFGFEAGTMIPATGLTTLSPDMIPQLEALLAGGSDIPFLAESISRAKQGLPIVTHTFEDPRFPGTVFPSETPLIGMESLPTNIPIDLGGGFDPLAGVHGGFEQTAPSSFPGLSDALSAAAIAMGGLDLLQGKIGPGLGKGIVGATGLLAGPGPAAMAALPLLFASMDPHQGGIGALGSLFGFGPKRKPRGPGILPATESVPGLRNIEAQLKQVAELAGLPSPGGTETLGGRATQHPIAGSVLQGGTLGADPGSVLAELAPILATSRPIFDPRGEGEYRESTLAEKALAALSMLSPRTQPYAQAFGGSDIDRLNNLLLANVGSA